MAQGPLAASDAAPDHSGAYRLRRFFNWFPLGLTYAAFYMGRYNFVVVKGFMGATFHLSKAETGLIATVAFWTYALAVIFNGPLADRWLGGRRAILFGALGTAALNACVGLLFLEGWHAHVLLGMCVLWAVNHYFQSFGALSVVKINAPWFHTRERGFFGGVFGIMISGGYWLAVTVGGLIFKAWPWYWVFLTPAIGILVMFFVDLALVRNTPGEAGHADFDTGDAGGSDGSPVDLAYIARMVFRNPVVLTIAAAEFCTGFVRQGLLLNFTEFLTEVHGVGPKTELYGWTGPAITLGGIVGGLLCGTLSDRVFRSRRPPVAFLFYVMQIGALLLLGHARSPRAAVFLIGFACTWIFGVHGMLSGTASADFGGKKAAATAAGFLDGIQYVASGFAGLPLGWLLQRYGWGLWTWSILPFSLVGALLMLRIWNAQPRGHADPLASGEGVAPGVISPSGS